MRSGIDLLPLPFEGEEEEQLVAILRVFVAKRDRSAKLPAWIIVFALRLRRAGDRIRPIVRGELFSSWRLLFERLAERAPVLMRFEYVHWADQGLFDNLYHAVRAFTQNEPQIDDMSMVILKVGAME